MPRKRPVWIEDAENVGRGMLMGGADVIPGVSGGTVALVLGIYSRLVTSISRFDHRFLAHVGKRELSQAARHVDMRFLCGLLLGIGLGIALLGEITNRLLSTPQTRPLALATFFGMILASSLVVLRRIRVNRTGQLLLVIAIGLAGAALAYWVTGLPHANAAITLPYVFVSGMIAICAMILPGISGAYLLLILGLYIHLTDIIKNIRHWDVNSRDLAIVFTFMAGCAVGIIAFSKLLRWLLANAQAPTMALLGGFMVGALRKIWPYQQPLWDGVETISHRQYRNVLPHVMDGHFFLCVLLAGIGFSVVFLLQHWNQTTNTRISSTKRAAERAV